MADESLIQLVCRQEDTIVALITGGTIDVAAVKSAEVKKLGMMPPGDKIKEGEGLRCGRCHGLLYFKAADGELVLAIPGQFEAKS